MAALTSSSTLADIEAAYADNSAYAVNDSPPQALLFEQACMLLIRKSWDRVSDGGADMQRKIELLQKEKEQAHQWYHEHVAGGSATVAYFSRPVGVE